MPKPGALAGLSEDAILEALVERFRAALAEEGIPERIKRRGWGRYSVDITVRDWEVQYANVGINVQHRNEGH